MDVPNTEWNLKSIFHFMLNQTVSYSRDASMNIHFQIHKDPCRFISNWVLELDIQFIQKSSLCDDAIAGSLSIIILTNRLSPYELQPEDMNSSNDEMMWKHSLGLYLTKQKHTKWQPNVAFVWNEQIYSDR